MYGCLINHAGHAPPVAVTAKQMIASAEQENVSSAFDRANHVDDIVTDWSKTVSGVANSAGCTALHASSHVKHGMSCHMDG